MESLSVLCVKKVKRLCEIPQEIPKVIAKHIKEIRLNRNQDAFEDSWTDTYDSPIGETDCRRLMKSPGYLVKWELIGNKEYRRPMGGAGPYPPEAIIINWTIVRHKTFVMKMRGEYHMICVEEDFECWKETIEDDESIISGGEEKSVDILSYGVACGKVVERNLYLFDWPARKLGELVNPYI
jgi:hypothetical protein